MNWVRNILFLCLLVAPVLQATPVVAQVSDMELAQGPEDVKVLAIIGDDFGYPFFDMRDYWESWGCNFTVASTVPVPLACHNRPRIPVEADVLVTNLTRDDIIEFDIVFLTAGAHMIPLGTNDTVEEVVRIAYEEGLVIATICWGLKILSFYEGMLDGIRCVTIPGPEVPGAGGFGILGTVVVTDKRIVSGDNGEGAFSYLETPMQATCAESVREALGLSRVLNTTVESITGSEYSLSVETVNPYESLDIWNYTGVSSVDALILPIHNDTVVERFELEDLDEDGVFTGLFNMTENGDYRVTIEIIDNDLNCEYIRNSTVFTAGVDEPTTPDPAPVDAMAIAMIGGAAAVVVVVVLVVVKKRG